MKKNYFFSVVSAMLLMTAPVFAQELTDGQEYTDQESGAIFTYTAPSEEWTENPAGWALTDGTAVTGNYVIPEEIMGQPVTAIGSDAFVVQDPEGDRFASVNTQLTGITIPDCVTSIGIAAFMGCVNLTGDVRMMGVKGQLYAVFLNCPNITSVTFGRNAAALEINPMTFNLVKQEVDGDETYTFPDEEHVIPLTIYVPKGQKQAFIDSFGSATEYEDYTDYGPLYWYAQNDRIVETDHVDMEPFDVNDDNWNTYTVQPLADGTAKIIGFNGNIWNQDFTVPESLGGCIISSVGDNVFKGKTSIKTLTLPAAITEIGASAFEGCTALGGLLDLSNIVAIGEKAFYGCKDIYSVRLGKSAEAMTIGQQALEYEGSYGAQCIGQLYMPAGQMQAFEEKFGQADGPLARYFDKGFEGYSYNVMEYLFDEAGAYYYGWNSPTWDYSTEEPVMTLNMNWQLSDAGKVEGDYAVLNEVNGNPVTTISQSAFYNNTALTGITFPDNLETISSYAFNGCTSLTGDIELNNVRYIGNNAFYNCTGVTSFKIPWNADEISISDYAFAQYDESEGTSALPATIYVPTGQKEAYRTRFDGEGSYQQGLHYNFLADKVQEYSVATGIATIDHRQAPTEGYYDLRGMRVNRPGKGLYIHNGRKYVR